MPGFHSAGPLGSQRFLASTEPSQIAIRYSKHCKWISLVSWFVIHVTWLIHVSIYILYYCIIPYVCCSKLVKSAEVDRVSVAKFCNICNWSGCCKAAVAVSYVSLISKEPTCCRSAVPAFPRSPCLHRPRRQNDGKDDGNMMERARNIEELRSKLKRELKHDQQKATKCSKEHSLEHLCWATDTVGHRSQEIIDQPDGGRNSVFNQHLPTFQTPPKCTKPACHDYAMTMPWLCHDYAMTMPWLCHDIPDLHGARFARFGSFGSFQPCNLFVHQLEPWQCLRMLKEKLYFFGAKTMPA